MKLHATISILSTMLLIGLHGATSPDSCRDKTRGHDELLCNYFIMLQPSLYRVVSGLCLIFKKNNNNCKGVRGSHTYGVLNPLCVLSEVSHQALHVAFGFLRTTQIKTFRRILCFSLNSEIKASVSASVNTDNHMVSYLLYHMRGVMSHQILRCIDGAQDVGHLDLKNVEGGWGTHQVRSNVLKVRVCSPAGRWTSSAAVWCSGSGCSVKKHTPHNSTCIL